MKKNRVLLIFSSFIIAGMLFAVLNWSRIESRLYSYYTAWWVENKFDGTPSYYSIEGSDFESGDKFISIGFDDFRSSDFQLVAPLFDEYNAKATFNTIPRESDFSKAYIAQIDYLVEFGNEIGNHTWRHENFIFTDPLINGQDPKKLDGDQVPFPTNDDMRLDRGDGKNAFGYDIHEEVNTAYSDYPYPVSISALKNSGGGYRMGHPYR